MPLVRREPEERPCGVPAVANADLATGQARHLDTIAVGVTQRALNPVKTGTPPFVRTPSAVLPTLPLRWLVSFPRCAASGDGEPDGFTAHRLRECPRRRAIADLGQIGLEREREICGLARRGAERAPFCRQSGHQHQPASSVRTGWFAHPHGQGERRIVDVNAQMTAGAPNGKRDGLTLPARDGIGHQVTGEQDRDVGIDRDLPSTDDRTDLAAGFCRRSWFPGQPEATLV